MYTFMLCYYIDGIIQWQAILSLRCIYIYIYVQEPLWITRDSPEEIHGIHRDPSLRKQSLIQARGMRDGFFISKIPPTYPWKIPRMFHQQFMKEFLSLWGWKGKFGVFSQGMWAKSLTIPQVIQFVTFSSPTWRSGFAFGRVTDSPSLLTGRKK